MPVPTRPVQPSPPWGVSAALVMDVDGVVSAVHPEGDAWGDEVTAGHLFGPVRVSPTLCRRLDALGSLAHVVPLWLTSWAPESRWRMDPFPGRSWATLSTQEDAVDRSRAGRPGSFPPDPDRLDWWKWDVVRTWLHAHPQVRSLVWCDDHFALPLWADDHEDDGPEGPGGPDRAEDGTDRMAGSRVRPARWALEREDEPFLTSMGAVIGDRLAGEGVTATLLAPDTKVGLLPADLDRVESALLAVAPD